MALYKESHKIKVFEPNEITLNAVQGEGNEREYEFRLIEKSGDTLKTSNAQVTDKMLDVTGCSVRLYVAKPDGCIVYMDGSISDAPGGIISFIPKQQVFAAAGKANCILQVTSANGDLRAIGVTLNIGKANIDGALESTNELSALTSALIELQEAIRNGTEGTEVPLARGGETLLGLRLDKIESGARIAPGAVSLDKMSAEAKAAFAMKDHNHDSTYIKNTDGVITAGLLSAAAKALFASANHTHSGYAKVNPAGVLDGAVSVLSASLKNAVDTAAIIKGSVTTDKLADGAVTTDKLGAGSVTGEKIKNGAITEGKLDAGFLQKYGHLPFTDVADYGNSADIPYDDYTNNGVYRFTGRYTPIILFVFIGSVSYTTQIRIQGEQIQTRLFNVKEWTEWSGGKAEIAESITQLDAQIAQLQIDTQAHGAKLDTLDRMYAGTAAIATTNSYKMDAAQVVPNSKVYLTFTNGPSTSCFVRSDYYPLYYYKTNQVVQPAYNTPIPVSAEDLIAGVKLNYGGAFTVTYQTAPSKVFFDYSDAASGSAADKLQQQIERKYEPYVKNQITEYAEGVAPEISDGAAGSAFRSVTVKGKTVVDDGAASGVSPTQIQTICPESEISYPLPDGVTLYGTPNDQYYDTYDAVSGILTRNCTVFAMSGGFIYGYNQASETIVWITDPLFRASKSYYLIKGGIVTSSTVDWQGKIQIIVPKTDAGITSADTSAQAREKMLAYWGGAYAILPAKTPAVEQYPPIDIIVPEGTFTIRADYGDISAGYCKDADRAYLDIIAVQLDLEGRVAQLEISAGGGETV